MPTIYAVKPHFQALLRPLCRRMAQAGVSANQVTLFALLLSLLGGVLVILAQSHRFLLLSVPAILFIRMALNAIDGMLAREHGMQSTLGAILNEMGDVLSDSLLYLPFALYPGINPYLIVLLVVLAVMVEMMGVVAVQIGAGRRYDGPLGKSDRAFLFGLLGLLLALGITPGVWLDLLLLLAVLMSVVTLVNRARRALAETA